MKGHPSLSLRPGTPIFLHFLSPALVEALGYPLPVHPQSLDALLAILCATTSSVYAPYSFVWHLPPRGIISGVLKSLYDSGQLDLLTLHTDVDAFVKARLKAFSHDEAEQQFYLGKRRTIIPKLFDAPIAKQYRTSDILQSHLDAWSKTLVSQGIQLGNLVQSSLSKRREEGLTSSFFSLDHNLSPRSDAVRPLALEIERGFLAVYLREFNGVLLTGLRRSGAIDDLSSYSPFYDYRLIRQVTDAVLRPNVWESPKDHVFAAAEIRGSDEHRKFVAGLRAFLAVLFSASALKGSQSVQETRQRISGEIRFWLPRTKVSAGALNHGCYAKAASRLSEALLNIRRHGDSEVEIVLPHQELVEMPWREQEVIFISYCREDNEGVAPSERWLDRLLKVLQPIQDQSKVLLWSDKIMVMGDLWNDTLTHALDTARIALLMVSPNLLASGFIRQVELPRLLTRFSLNEVVIIPIILRACLLEEVRFKFPDPNIGPHSLSLGEFQTANPPNRPLNRLSEPEQDQVFVDIGRRLLRLLETSRGV